MSIFLTSDTHFYHTNIIKYCHRPFKDVDDMNEHMISRWNETITSDDVVYHLGDFAFNIHRNKLQWLFDRLNGHKILIKGNHDHKDTIKLSWESVFDYKEINHEGKLIVMMHYPLESWKNNSRGSIHFHGHIHSRKNVMNYDDVKKRTNRYDVGVDLNNFTPMLLEQAIINAERILNV